jgi:hypothetical protein
MASLITIVRNSREHLGASLVLMLKFIPLSRVLGSPTIRQPALRMEDFGRR